MWAVAPDTALLTSPVSSNVNSPTARLAVEVTVPVNLTVTVTTSSPSVVVLDSLEEAFVVPPFPRPFPVKIPAVTMAIALAGDASTGRCAGGRTSIDARRPSRFAIGTSTPSWAATSRTAASMVSSTVDDRACHPWNSTSLGNPAWVRSRTSSAASDRMSSTGESPAGSIASGSRATGPTTAGPVSAAAGGAEAEEAPGVASGEPDSAWRAAGTDAGRPQRPAPIASHQAIPSRRSSVVRPRGGKRSVNGTPMRNGWTLTLGTPARRLVTLRSRRPVVASLVSTMTTLSCSNPGPGVSGSKVTYERHSTLPGFRPAPTHCVDEHRRPVMGDRRAVGLRHMAHHDALDPRLPVGPKAGSVAMPFDARNGPVCHIWAS